MQRRIKYGFIILLIAEDMIRLFGEKLKPPRIAAVPQAHRRLQLILNLSDQPDPSTPSVNESTNREAAPESLQFGRAFPTPYRRFGGRTRSRVRSRCLSWTSQMRTTAAPLSRGRWVHLHTSSHRNHSTRYVSSALTCSFWWGGWTPPIFLRVSETLTDMANALVDTYLPIPSYGVIFGISVTLLGPSHTPDSLTHIDCYMYDVISVVKGGSDCQQ